VGEHVVLRSKDRDGVTASLGNSAALCLAVYAHHITGGEPRWNGAIEDAMPV